MNDLSACDITARWPAQHPDRIQLKDFPRVMAAVEAFRAPSAVAAGLRIPA